MQPIDREIILLDIFPISSSAACCIPLLSINRFFRYVVNLVNRQTSSLIYRKSVVNENSCKRGECDLPSSSFYLLFTVFKCSLQNSARPSYDTECTFFGVDTQGT